MKKDSKPVTSKTEIGSSPHSEEQIARTKARVVNQAEETRRVNLTVDQSRAERYGEYRRGNQNQTWCTWLTRASALAAACFSHEKGPDRGQ
jgi:hypothetical protein